jgi:uracil-DNA glycosylase
VVVALGRVAAQALLDTDAPLGRLRGEDHDYAGIPLVVTYHPAYLLRSPADKAKAWTDLLRARTLMLRP